MSYDLHFIKNKDLTIQQSLDFLEKSQVSKEFHFSEAEKETILSEITNMKQHIAINKSNTSVEIDFDIFQISLFDTQLIISVPFSKENLAQKTTVQVNCLIDIFLGNGAIGFDGQSEEFIDDDYSFKTLFAQSLSVVSASKKSDTKVKKFANKETAENFYFKERDQTLSLVESLKLAYPKKKLDFTPESLKNLEWVFYEVLDNDAFGKSLPTKDEFYKLLSIYKAKVYVDHKAFQWNICENFYQKSFQLAIQTRNKMHTIFIAPKEEFEDNPDGKKQALLKEYARGI